ncbi:MAG: tRNA (adenosine(37)-N6)-threonylcarbamoyltransferase complex transferase subunit TsaD [Myxococcales bacterium]|nr:tRNA (adenosine(37)-N6)-threonylcarbamoyltransferase complex transferase subunit TsaD [Myxococcales bacterium]
MIVLGIETSCDDTAAAVVDESGVRSDVVWSQSLHERYGGVVPELASRAHAEQIVPVVRAALTVAGVDRPDAIAVTAGPGLMGAVLVGLCFAKSASVGWGVPFLGVNHLEGHLLSGLMEPVVEGAGSVAFPFLSLVISGGHSTLYKVLALGRYEVVSETVDDAIGEAYDKVARMLGLGYPGGPLVDRLAGLGKPTIAFPRPRLARLVPGTAERAPVDDMSFSGLKTAVRTAIERDPGLTSADRAPDVCASFQQAVVDVINDRVRQAARASGIGTVLIGGGAAANEGIRAGLLGLGLRVVLPPKGRCTDNAAMIAHVGRLHLLAGCPPDPLFRTAQARWSV